MRKHEDVQTPFALVDDDRLAQARQRQNGVYFVERSLFHSFHDVVYVCREGF